MEGAACWPVPHDLLKLLSYTTQIDLPSRWAFKHLVIIEENTPAAVS